MKSNISIVAFFLIVVTTCPAFAELNTWNALNELAVANADLAQQMKDVPEIADGLNAAEAKALDAIAKLCEDKSEYRQSLIRLLLQAPKDGRLGDFNYNLPTYHCPSRILLWLAMDDKLKGSENLCLAVAITDGLFLNIGDDDVKEALKKDSVDMVTFFLETEMLQKKLGHKPLRDFPPSALLMLTWRGASIASHSFDSTLKPGYFLREIRRAPMSLAQYRILVLAPEVLREMRKTLTDQGKGDQRKMASKGYAYYQPWEETFNDKPRIISIGAQKFHTPWTQSATLIFERRQKEGKGIGNCADQDDARQAMWKSIGIPSMSFKMVQLRKEFTGKMFGHIISVYYDSGRKAWCGMNATQSEYSYCWAMFLVPVRYQDFLTAKLDFPQCGTRDYGVEIVTGQGKQGGRNETLTSGITQDVMEKAIVEGVTKSLGAALMK